MLKTGWKSWDEYLERYANIDTPLQLLDAGGPKEEITKWFAKNLASNPYTKIYSIHPRHTFKNDHIVKVSMNVEKGLIHLVDTLEKESIDIAFLNLFHETQDATEDCIRIWKLLKTNGVLILDDLVWREIEYERYYSRAAITQFIRVYAPEMRILYTGYQIICEKLDKTYWESFALDYKEYPLVHYADWREVMKDVNRISDKVMLMKPLKLLTNRTRRAVRHKPLVFSEPRIGTTPSFTELDKLEETIRTLVTGRERILFNKELSPNIAKHSSTFQNELGYLQPENFKHYSWLKQSNISLQLIQLLQTYKIKHRLYAATIEQIDTGFATYSQIKETHDFYKHYTPSLEKMDRFLLIRSNMVKEYETKLQAMAPRERALYKLLIVDDILDNKITTIPAKTYDLYSSHSIGFPLLSYADYQTLKFRGRDSKTIHNNLLYMLLADHALVKGGMFTCSIYGDITPIVCEFITLLSEFFEEPFRLEKTFTTPVNEYFLSFRGYKGMNALQRSQIVSLYKKITNRDEYYTSLGVSCNPTIQRILTTYKTQFKKQLETLFIIAKEFHTLLENIPVSRHAAITNYLISQRITNYSIALTEFISKYK